MKGAFDGILSVRVVESGRPVSIYGGTARVAAQESSIKIPFDIS